MSNEATFLEVWLADYKRSANARRQQRVEAERQAIAEAWARAAAEYRKREADRRHADDDRDLVVGVGEQAEDQRLVGLGEGAERVRDGEDDVVVGHG